MSLTIGQRLKKAREDRYLTLEKAADETRIRSIFLQALEADDFSVMPSAVQGRGFLRNYAEYLDINIDEIIAEMQRNALPLEEVSGPLPQVNLLETELPSLTGSDEDIKPRPFSKMRRRLARASELAREQKEESTLEPESAEPAPQETPAVTGEVETEPVKLRGRKKKKVEESDVIGEPPVTESTVSQEEIIEPKPQESTLLVETEQVEVKEEAKVTLFARVASLFRARVARPSPSLTSQKEEGVEPNSESKPALPAESADAIFVEIGKQLRERRELISLAVDEVERHTRLRTVFVKALEEGAFDKLPSPVQTRGMLANYAAFLDLDADAILLRFADALQARRREKYSETPREKIQTEVIASMPLLRGFIAGDLIFGIVMIVIILALAIWGLGRVMNLQSQPRIESTAPSIVDVLAGTHQPTPSAQPTFAPVNEGSVATNGASGTTVEAPTLNVNANVTVSIFAVERTFVPVSVDGEVVFEGRISPRETQVYEASDQVVVLTGNAAALRITYNGRDLGLMGNVGEVVNRVYLISGVVTPTATLPPTATNTPLVTTTPTPTLTPIPEVTLTP